MYTLGIITISDKGAAGQREDKSGPKIKELLPGTLITVAAWAIALIGFTVYLKIGNMGRLYGALSAIIVFMLWLYVLMICFVAGVIFNSEKISARESKAL